MELMGHKTPQMTMRYTHLSVEYKRNAVESLPRFEITDRPAESLQISQQAEKQKVVKFVK